MRAVPLGRTAANAFVVEHHRHSGAVHGFKFAVGAEAAGELVGVAIGGRPSARALDDGSTIEVTRVCTAGHRNACSFLYARVCRAAAALGYRRAVTYKLEEEDGASLKASGFRLAEPSRPGRRDRCGRDGDHRPRERWERQLGKAGPGQLATGPGPGRER